MAIIAFDFLSHMTHIFTFWFQTFLSLRLHLDTAEKPNMSASGIFLYSFFLACVWETNLTVTATIHALFMNSSRNVWLFPPFSTHHYYSWNPQTSFFSNFFIKNGSHGTIHIFKNYFTTVFFSFQFSVFSCIQTDPKLANHNQSGPTSLLVYEIVFSE